MRRLFTVDEYHRMAEAGILDEDDRVELIGGEILQMTPIGSKHGGCVKWLNNCFVGRLGDRVVVGIQDPVILDDLSEPQPDVSLCRPSDDYYSSTHPRPGDLYLVIEVADTSQRRDRELKIPRYGRAGVPEAWLVDVEAEHIEIYRDPGPDGYASVEVVDRSAGIAPVAFPDLKIAVDDILH
jgi:Uma2 family endonuclease